MSLLDLDMIRDKLCVFVKDSICNQIHNPNNLAIALIVELDKVKGQALNIIALIIKNLEIYPN